MLSLWNTEDPTTTSSSLQETFVARPLSQVIISLLPSSHSHFPRLGQMRSHSKHVFIVLLAASQLQASPVYTRQASFSQCLSDGGLSPVTPESSDYSQESGEWCTTLIDGRNVSSLFLTNSVSVSRLQPAPSTLSGGSDHTFLLCRHFYSHQMRLCCVNTSGSEEWRSLLRLVQSRRSR